MAASTNLPISKQLSTGAILCANINGVPHIVLLVQDNDFYKRTGEEAKKKIIDIGPCGGLNEDENPLEGASREVEEEVGLTPEIDSSFYAEYSYEFDAVARSTGKMSHIVKTRGYYYTEITEAQLKKMKLSPEHKEKMIVPLDEATVMKELQQQQRETLLKLKAYLS